jgi:curli production assembly/transport component CsgE
MGTIAAAQPLEKRLEIDGLILDQTKTRAGHDFYDRFGKIWEAPPGMEGYNILIIENASPQWGSVIWIKVNDNVVFQGMLQPREAEIRDLAEKAAERVRGYVTFYLKEEHKMFDKDLAKDGW